MKFFVFVRFVVSRFRRKRPPSRAPEWQAVPVWIGSQVSAFPLIIEKRPRPTAKFYDEWE